MANIADITWSAVGLTFSEAERAAAVAGTTLPPDEQYVRIIQPTKPVLDDGFNTGSVDPDQMMADGFIYFQGKWIRSQGAAKDVEMALAGAAGGGGSGKPSTASLTTTAVIGGTVLGVQVPAAAPVLLPSFVGGRVGRVVQSGGLRPSSGGTPRIVKGYGARPKWARVVR